MRNAVVTWLRHKKPPPQTPLSDFERVRDEVRPCDVVLVEGRSRVSEVIKMITQSAWSHAALYIGRLDELEDQELRDLVEKNYFGKSDQQLIIESELGMGTIVRSLNSYEYDHLRICRPKNLDTIAANKVIRYCIGRLGSAYNVRQIFDLARFLFPWFIMPRRWRSSLFSARPGKSTQTVCSTMIAEAFGSVEFPILPLVKKIEHNKVKLYLRNPKLCTPRDFDYSPYFDIVKYPFLDFAHYAQKHLKPWTGTLDISEEERKFYVVSEAPEEDHSSPG
ncbi:MAG: hypothetical protein V7709_04650 [Halioglobus sp.]